MAWNSLGLMAMILFPNWRHVYMTFFQLYIFISSYFGNGRFNTVFLHVGVLGYLLF